jgi:peptide/nickel transport system permease protein
MLIIVFALRLNLFPAGGMVTLGATTPTGLAHVADVAWHLILPTIAAGSFYLALVTRITRGNILGVLKQDYIRTAIAKGLSQRTVLFRHALKNALLPIATVIGGNIAFVLAGEVLIETIYGWPGMGRLIFDSLWARDYPVLLGSFIFTSIMVVATNLATDLLYVYFDPRVRLYS